MHRGPDCGTEWCEAWQVCCNGQCCSISACLPGDCIGTVCVPVAVCDEGNICTNDPCTPGECDNYTCLPKVANNNLCDDQDGDICTIGQCENMECEPTPKCPGQNCCDNGTCCSVACNACEDHGQLSGSIAVDPPVACVGEEITFTLTANDTGGTKRVNCVPQGRYRITDHHLGPHGSAGLPGAVTPAFGHRDAM